MRSTGTLERLLSTPLGKMLISLQLLLQKARRLTDDQWQLIDAHERGAGEPHGRPRVKLVDVAEMLRIGRG